MKKFAQFITEAVKPSFGHHADTVKKKMIKKSDKNKLLKIRQMLDKEKKPVRKEAMSPKEKAAHDKAIADFKKKGGKVKKLPPGKAQGSHGKEDPGDGVMGMLDRGDSSKFKRGKKVKSMRR